MFVFAAGNEYTVGDDVNTEGWLNSQYTISVAAIGKDAKHSSYSSVGAPNLISAGGGDSNHKINMFTTTPLEEGGCAVGRNNSIGTSYAAPVVSGVVALILEANGGLGWRDVQDILVRSAAPIDMDMVQAEWTTNAAGFKHSFWYGFGKVDALAAVIMAESYSAAETNLQQAVVTKSANETITIADNDESGGSSVIAVSAEDGAALLSVQHVNVYVNINHNNRGDLVIKLTSPSGVESVLMPRTVDGVSEQFSTNGAKRSALTHLWPRA